MGAKALPEGVLNADVNDVNTRVFEEWAHLYSGKRLEKKDKVQAELT